VYIIQGVSEMVENSLEWSNEESFEIIFSSLKPGFYLIIFAHKRFIVNFSRESSMGLSRVFHARVVRIKIYGVTYRFVWELGKINKGDIYLSLI
jgi:hypothetical protein